MNMSCLQQAHNHLCACLGHVLWELTNPKLTSWDETTQNRKKKFRRTNHEADICARMQCWLTRKSPKCYKKHWGGWEASGAAANQIHSAIRWNVEKETEREHWLEVSCWMGWSAVILQSLPSLDLTIRFFNKWAFCQSFHVAVSNHNVNCPNAQASDLPQSSSA